MGRKKKTEINEEVKKANQPYIYIFSKNRFIIKYYRLLGKSESSRAYREEMFSECDKLNGKEVDLENFIFTLDENNMRVKSYLIKGTKSYTPLDYCIKRRVKK